MYIHQKWTKTIQSIATRRVLLSSVATRVHLVWFPPLTLSLVSFDSIISQIVFFVQTRRINSRFLFCFHFLSEGAEVPMIGLKSGAILPRPGNFELTMTKFPSTPDEGGIMLDIPEDQMENVCVTGT